MKPPAGSSDASDDALIDALHGVERGLYVVGRPVPMLKRVVKRPFTWDDAEPGFVFPALEYVVTPAALDRFAALAGACGLELLARERTTVPLMFFTDEPMQCIVTLFQKSGRLHAGHVIEGLRAIPVGATVRSVATVERRVERSAGQFVDVSCLTSLMRDGKAIPAVRTVATLVL